MRRSALISSRAEADLRGIWRWTQEKFGAAQADDYLDELDGGIAACVAAPERGKDRAELREGYRSVLVGRHVVFYTFTDDEVVIRRVLHGSMDFEGRLGE